MLIRREVNKYPKNTFSWRLRDFRSFKRIFSLKNSLFLLAETVSERFDPTGNTPETQCHKKRFVKKRLSLVRMVFWQNWNPLDGICTHHAESFFSPFSPFFLRRWNNVGEFARWVSGIWTNRTLIPPINQQTVELRLSHNVKILPDTKGKAYLQEGFVQQNRD